MFKTKSFLIISVMLVVFLVVAGVNFGCAPKPLSPPPAPAAFQISKLSVVPIEAKPGEKVAITAEVSNTGGTEGSYTVELKINDSPVAKETVTIAAKDSKVVTFTVSRDIVGIYKITVDGVSKELIIKLPIRIQYLGWASFLITASTGLKIITDPYAVAAGLNFSPIDETADIVTVSHEHFDHNNVAAVKGNPEVVRGSGVKNIKGIEFKGIATWHDEVKGALRGANIVISFSVDGVKFSHLGDLGHRLSPEQVAEIGKVDVLFIPVGGLFTIDAKTATEVYDDLKPKVIIPMHYKTPKVGYTVASVEDFLKEKGNVRRLTISSFELKPGELPAVPEIVVLEPAK